MHETFLNVLHKAFHELPLDEETFNLPVTRNVNIRIQTKDVDMNITLTEGEAYDLIRQLSENVSSSLLAQKAVEDGCATRRAREAAQKWDEFERNYCEAH